MHGKTKFLLFLMGFLVLGFVQSVYAGYTIHFPQGQAVNLAANTTYRFGDCWINSTVVMRVTAYFEGNWLNYTVSSAGTQLVHNDTKPTLVYIDGVSRSEGDGWSYSSGTVTVASVSHVQLYWGSTGGMPFNFAVAVTALAQALGNLVTNILSEVVPLLNVWGTWYNGIYIFALVPIICFAMAAICLLVNPKLALVMVVAGVISTLGVGLAIYYTAIAGNALSSFLLSVLA
jgi:hypothetical protein